MRDRPLTHGMSNPPHWVRGSLYCLGRGTRRDHLLAAHPWLGSIAHAMTGGESDIVMASALP
jgi:hypothetical protein